MHFFSVKMEQGFATNRHLEINTINGQESKHIVTTIKHHCCTESGEISIFVQEGTEFVLIPIEVHNSIMNNLNDMKTTIEMLKKISALSDNVIASLQDRIRSMIENEKHLNATRYTQQDI